MGKRKEKEDLQDINKVEETLTAPIQEKDFAEDVSKKDGSITPSPENQEDLQDINKVEEMHYTKCEQLVKEYRKVYPDQKVFHVTSDYQVFLGENLSHARNHQRTQKEGEVITIKIK